jgi:hypothetical protein
MALEDLYHDQLPIDYSIRQDVAGIANNLRRNIAAWRAQFQAGQDPRQGMRDAAQSYIRRIWRAMRAIIDSPADFDEAQGRLGMTKEQIQAELVERENALIAFRDAPMSNATQARNAITALEAAFPAPRTPSPRNLFITRELPTSRPI